MAGFGTGRPFDRRQKDNADLSKICLKISADFDAKGYRFLEEAHAASLSPVEHYVKFGEKAGACPNSAFDPVYYASRYPDIAKAGVNLFWHYLSFGRQEGRVGAAREIKIELEVSRLRDDLDTVFLVLHEASRTGAPILGWNILQELKDRYNVVTIFLKGGPIRKAFDGIATAIVEIPDDVGNDPMLWLSLAQELKAAYQPKFAIANSAATHFMAVALETSDVPVVALVHEFASDMLPVGVLSGLYTSVSKIVFPAKVVEENTRSIYTDLRGRQTFIAPQGQSRVPPFSGDHAHLKSGLSGDLTQSDKTFTVIGAGTVTYRKGVDLFVSVADHITNTLNHKHIRFLWIGTHIPPEAAYRSALDLQVKRCGLEESVEFVGEVDNLEQYLNMADLFFISSRLDPLPNVGIDAVLAGLPLVCFKDATGFSEMLEADTATKGFVARYANVQDAAEIISNAAARPENLSVVSDTIKNAATATFSMSNYVVHLEHLAEEAIAQRKIAENDAQVIGASGMFNQTFCLGLAHQDMERSAAIRKYVDGSRRSWPLARHFTGTFIRRPMVGFNPLIYDMHVNGQAGTPRDPFADFLDKGRPDGPWCHTVITPDNSTCTTEPKVALHCHFHYADLLDELLDAIAVNKLKPDLFVTTTSEAALLVAEQTLARRSMKAKEIWTVPNVGRDILCFLKDMPAKLEAGGYEIVGHVHGKKSTHVDAATGDVWRNFLWGHLIGAQSPMIDEICAHLEKRPDIGLVFPEDPHLNGWDFNQAIAMDLADRLAIVEPLPFHFDFPIGTMFWARTQALKPLFDMPLLLEEVPPEPVAIDGTILHALERIIPFAVRKAGFTYATTHVDGIWR